MKKSYVYLWIYEDKGDMIYRETIRVFSNHTEKADFLAMQA